MKTLQNLFLLALCLLPIQIVAETSSEIPAMIDEIMPQLMEKQKVPGASIALVQDHEIVWLGQYGVTSADNPNPVTRETIFEAASMSKPAFAYVALRLVEEGLLDLDTPLVEYLGHPYIEDEALHEQITARIVLSHRTGFPNWRKGGWRNPTGPLAPKFVPGTGYSYSGEGFLFLQRVVEHLTGKTAEELAREYLLDPIGMDSSSYVWQKAYDKTASAGHTSSGKIPERKRSIYRTPNTAFTLYTTPEDYAKILITMMRPADAQPALLADELRSLMLHPETLTGSRRPIDRGDENQSGLVYFGLGWRIETTPNGMRYCHSGSNSTGFRCYSEFIPESGDGIVIMTNSASGREVWEAIRAAIGPNLGNSSSTREKESAGY